MAKTTKTTTAPASEQSDNRYVRAFRVLAADNKGAIDAIAKQASISERAARSCVDVWNAAIQALAARAALAVDPAELLHTAPADPAKGFSRAVRILAAEGEGIEPAELAAKANVSEATARRAAQAYRDVLVAQRAASAA